MASLWWVAGQTACSLRLASGPPGPQDHCAWQPALLLALLVLVRGDWGHSERLWERLVLGRPVPSHAPPRASSSGCTVKTVSQALLIPSIAQPTSVLCLGDTPACNTPLSEP